MITINLIKGKKRIDITKFSGNVTLSDSLDTLGAAFNFDIARNFNDPNFATSEIVETGNVIEFKNRGEVVFLGIIVTIGTEKFKKSIKCLDPSFYLNKNKLIKQFKNISASDAIKNMCNQIGVKTGDIDNIATSITKIYKDKTVAEIIKDILTQVLDETGKKYKLEINKGGLDVKKHKLIEAKKPYEFWGRITKNEDITEMKNVILVTSNNQDDVNTMGKAMDEAGIEKYGRLQEIVEVEPKDVSKVRNIANKKLKELNKVFTSVDVQTIGDNSLRSGRIIEVINKEFNLISKYLIKSANHKYSKGNHTTNLNLEVN
ncbi:MAG: hypothetical protein WBG30_08715 [Psychrilyobacter sp.]|uniref:XkdQ/YqbQ family protein n=1 Tax=Psychrilyobacter sp. TaxID=2586924 RepID=UPI003C78B303